MLTVTMNYTSQIDSYIATLRNVVAVESLVAAQNIAAAAQERVHVVTGSLKNSIDVDILPGATDLSSHSVNAGNLQGGYVGGGQTNKPAGAKVDYAAAQEYGPGVHTPFMTPAAETGWLPYVDRVSVAIGSIT